MFPEEFYTFLLVIFPILTQTLLRAVCCCFALSTLCFFALFETPLTNFEAFTLFLSVSNPIFFLALLRAVGNISTPFTNFFP